MSFSKTAASPRVQTGSVLDVFFTAIPHAHFGLCGCLQPPAGSHLILKKIDLRRLVTLQVFLFDNTHIKTRLMLNEKALNKYVSLHFATWRSKVCCCLIPQTLLSLLPSSWEERYRNVLNTEEPQCLFMAKL